MGKNGKKVKIVLGQLEGLTASYDQAPPTENDIDMMLDEIRKKYAEHVRTDGPVHSGDTATISYTFGVEEKDLPKTFASEMIFTVGEGRVLPEFEENLIGSKVGEEKVFEVRFPEDYPDANLAGKAGELHAKVIACTQKRIPEWTDALAEKISGLKSVDEMKASLREKRMRLYEIKREEALRAQLIQTAMENAVIEMDPSVVEEELASAMSDLEDLLRQRNTDMTAYLTSIGKTLSKLKYELKKEIRSKLATTGVLLAIADKYGLFPDERTVMEGLRIEAEAQKKSVREYCMENPMSQEEVTARFRMELAVDYLYEKAIIRG